jgi:hypothetical protein
MSDIIIIILLLIFVIGFGLMGLDMTSGEHF